jgi:hypothetical protein
MKLKNTNALVSAKAQSKKNSGNDSRQKARRKIWLRLAAIFLAIVFLASECAILLPVE